MIVVYGAVYTEIDIKLDPAPALDDVKNVLDYRNEVGGKAANQALAATRHGAKTALVAKVGDDVYAERLMRKIRMDGVMTSGVAHSDLKTGMRTRIREKSKQDQLIYAPSANKELNAEQVPDEILGPKNLLLLQTELSHAQNIEILTKAKEYGAQTMMNLSPSTALKQEVLSHIDYLIINADEATRLADKMGLSTGDNALKIAAALSKQGALTCILTQGENGCVAVTAKGEAWDMGALQLEEVIDKTGAEAAFCGTFAACIEAKLPIATALKRASIAATLTCTKQGMHESLPHLHDIEEQLENLADAKKISL